MIGDVLFVWSDEETPTTGRSATWQELGTIGQTRLWQQSTSDLWVGFPIESGDIVGWRYWLLGELSGDPRSQVETFLAGQLSAAQLNGHFSLIAWQKDERRWHVWTNRLGTFHLYWGRQNGRTALGTFCPGVAHAIKAHSLDWYGLTGFFSWGFFPQDHTHFEGVQILRPATHSVWDENGTLCLQERYWQWHFEPNGARNYDDTVTEFAHIFQEIVTEQAADERVAVPISGGLDSRSILAAVADHTGSNRQLWAYSYGYSPDSIEVRIGEQLALVRSLDFQKFTIQPYLFDNIDRVLTCVEGFQDVTQSRQAAIAGPLHQHADVVLAGHWGDVWLDSMGMLGKDPTNLADAVLHKLEKRGRQWFIGTLGLQQQVRKLKETVTQELSQYAQLDEADFRVKAFKTDQWSWRWTTASVRMYQTSVLPRLPFYDNRLLDFFCTVPTEYVAGRRLQIDYLKRFSPDLARVTWQTYRTNLYRYQYFNSWLIPARAWHKMKRLLTNQPTISRNWEVQFLFGDGPEKLKAALHSELNRVHEFVPERSIQKLLKAFFTQPDASNGYTVSMLYTFAAWLNKYG